MLEKIKNNKLFLLFFLVIIAIFVLLKLPSLVEPIWFIDEGIYSAIAHVVARGGLVYKDAWDNKPPSIYFLFLVSRLFFSYTIIPLKIFTDLLSLGTLIILLMTVQKWFKNYNKYFLLLCLFIFVILNSLEGNLVNTETIFAFFSISSFYLLSSFDEEDSYLRFIIAGLLMGIGLSFKMVVILDMGAFILCYLIFVLERKDFIVKKIFLLCVYILSSCLPLFIYYFYFYIKGAGNYFLEGVFLSNNSYVSVYNTSIFNINTLYINAFVSLILTIVVLILHLKRDTLGKLGIRNKYVFFITIWIIFGLFAATISGRPYTHYLLQVEVPATIGIALLLYSRSIVRILCIGMLLFVFIIYFNRNAQNPLFIKGYDDALKYYQYSYSYIFGRYTKFQYYNTFDIGSNGLNANALYNLITVSDKYYTSHNDNIYIWGNIQWVDAGTKLTPVCRYLNDFDIQENKSMQEWMVSCLKESKPKIIIDENSQYNFPGLKDLERAQYILRQTLYNNTVRIYERQ